MPLITHTSTHIHVHTHANIPRYGGLTVLVNNAGIAYPGDILGSQGQVRAGKEVDGLRQWGKVVGRSIFEGADVDAAAAADDDDDVASPPLSCLLEVAWLVEEHASA